MVITSHRNKKNKQLHVQQHTAVHKKPYPTREPESEHSLKPSLRMMRHCGGVHTSLTDTGQHKLSRKNQQINNTQPTEHIKRTSYRCIL